MKIDQIERRVTLGNLERLNVYANFTFLYAFPFTEVLKTDFEG